jgi:hypothetical protein
MTVRQVQGQALVEALAALLFLAPLVLCLLHLADMNRVAHAASLAAREFALAAVHQPSGELDPSLARALQRLATEDLGETAEYSAPQWYAVATDGPVAATEDLAGSLLLPALASGKGVFDWPRWRGQRVVVGALVSPLESLRLPEVTATRIEEKLIFFAGHGSAIGPQHVASRTAALSAAGSLTEVGEQLEPFLEAASVIEPALGRLCIGRIGPDIVPEDRLPTGISQTTDLRNQPC